MRTKRQGMVRVRAAALAETLEARQLLTATILARYTFYGDSPADTSSTSVRALIAPDKTALLPGQTATFANYTSYVKGVNGIAIDASNWPATPVASDFVIRAGNTSNPSAWTTITQAATFSMERGAGTGGSDRIVIRLSDNTYRNQWVQVTVNPTADTALSSPDVFYFANAVGDDGHGLTNAIVDASNESSARLGAHGFTNTAGAADLYDFNRDGRVDITDQLIARQSVNTAATALPYVTVPALADPGPAGAFAAVFNVKSYGATGDGTTNDTAAIQNAIAALSTVGQGLLYFPAGTYRIQSRLMIQNLNNFEIRGVGATIKANAQLESADGYGDLLRLVSCSNFTINGLTFDGDMAERPVRGDPSLLRLNGGSDFRVTNCTFNNTICDALFLCATVATDDSTAAHDGLVEGCTINSAYRNGISVIHASRVQFASNFIQNVGGTAPEAGVDVEPDYVDSNHADHDLSFVGNRFQNIAATGICITYVQNSVNIVANSNQFAHCMTAIFNGGTNTVMDNNVCHDYYNSPAGISYGMLYSSNFQYGNHVEVTGNTVYSLGGVNAICIDPLWIGSALVSDNRLSNLSGTGFDAINLNDDNAVVTANVITNCTGIPIAVGGANADVESNIVSGGSAIGITVAGSAMIVRGNSVSNFPTGLYLTDNISTGATARVSIVTGNTVTGCATGLLCALVRSQITANTFSNATRPASGPGSESTGEILLLSATNATALIGNNILTGISGVTGINVVGSWTGQLTIVGNQLTNIDGAAISANAPAVITTNTMTNTGGMGIFGNNSDVENNIISGGFGTGIYAAADGVTYKGNTFTNQSIGMQVAEPAGGPIAGLTTIVSGNTFTNCYTGVLSAVVLSQITGNTFSNATKPTSGSGSDALAEILLLNATSATTVISYNTLTNLSGVAGIYLVGNWHGQAVLTNNQLTNIGGTGISTGAPSVVTANTITDAGGMEIDGNNSDVENNIVAGGFGTGIYAAADGVTYKGNTISGQATGIQLAEAAGGPVAGLYTVLDGNTFTDCYTAVFSGETNSIIRNNVFQNVTKPTSGTGSDATAQLFLAGVANGNATLSGNTLNNISGLIPILIIGNWKGSATITGNQISNLQGGVPAIITSPNATVITFNTLQNVSGGIVVDGTAMDVENNTITTSLSGIEVDGTGSFVRNNVLTDAGDPLIGNCIYTAPGHGTTVTGNTIRKTVPNPLWVPIRYASSDILGVNYAYGIGGLNGAFIPGSNASIPNDSTGTGSAPTGNDSDVTTPVQEPIVVTPVVTTPTEPTPIATSPVVVTSPIATTPVKKKPVIKKPVVTKKAPVLAKPAVKVAGVGHLLKPARSPLSVAEAFTA